MPGDDGEWARGLLVTSPPPPISFGCTEGRGGRVTGLYALEVHNDKRVPVAILVQAPCAFPFHFSRKNTHKVLDHGGLSMVDEDWGVHIKAIARFSPWLLCGSRREGETGATILNKERVQCGPRGVSI